MPGTVVISPLSDALLAVWGSTVAYLPNIVAAIIILIVGFVVGKLVGAALEEILGRTKVDEYVKVKKAEFKVSHIFTLVIKWVLYLVFVQQATMALGVAVISAFIGDIVGFLPRVIEAMVVIAAGYALARYIEGLVSESEFVYSDLMGRVFFFLIVYISIALALPLVGLSAVLVNWILIIIVGSIGLGFAIALGLGLRETVAEMSKSQIRKALRRK